MQIVILLAGVQDTVSPSADRPHLFVCVYVCVSRVSLGAIEAICFSFPHSSTGGLLHTDSSKSFLHPIVSFAPTLSLGAQLSLLQ